MENGGELAKSLAKACANSSSHFADGFLITQPTLYTLFLYENNINGIYFARYIPNKM